MNTEGTAIWDRLPSRALNPTELAAALPRKVPGSYMAVVGAYDRLASCERFEAVIVDSETGYHLLELGDTWARTARANDPDLGPGLSDVVDALGFDAVPTVVARRNVDADSADALADASTIDPLEYAVDVRDHGGDTPGGTVEYDLLPEDTAGETRRDLHRERLRESDGTALDDLVDAAQADAGRIDPERFVDVYAGDLPSALLDEVRGVDGVVFTNDPLEPVPAQGERATIERMAEGFGPVEGRVVDALVGYYAIVADSEPGPPGNGTRDTAVVSTEALVDGHEAAGVEQGEGGGSYEWSGATINAEAFNDAMSDAVESFADVAGEVNETIASAMNEAISGPTAIDDPAQAYVAEVSIESAPADEDPHTASVAVRTTVPVNMGDVPPYGSVSAYAEDHDGGMIVYVDGLVGDVRDTLASAFGSSCVPESVEQVTKDEGDAVRANPDGENTVDPILRPGE
ncbi:hypothetical protein HrrHc1_250 [Halorubrum phage Hardycor1]|nr:hypothetical protein HrrHc1_250 [Halorubrum phage Hardycor1]